MKFLSFLFLLGFAPLLRAQTSYVAPVKILDKKGYQFGVSADYFKTSKRVDKNGDKIDFQDGESFERLQGEAFAQYGLTGNFQIGGGVRYRQNKSTILNTTSNENESETSSGVESTFLNVMFSTKAVNGLLYTFEGAFRYRPFSNEETTATKTADLTLGDDGTEYSAGVGALYSSAKQNFLSGRIGYRNPGNDLSSEIYWQAEGALAWKYFALVAGAHGINSLNNDPYDGDPQNKPLLNTGSSALYNSTNRNMIAPYAGFNIGLGKSWRVELRGSQVVSGRSTDLGTSYGISLIRRVDNLNPDKPDTKFKNYDFEATVTKVSPKKGFIVLDKGLSEDIRKGLKIDFYEFDYVGGNILLASGIVIEAKADSSIVKVTHRYNTKKELKEGIVARGSFR